VRIYGNHRKYRCDEFQTVQAVNLLSVIRQIYFNKDLSWFLSIIALKRKEWDYQLVVIVVYDKIISPVVDQFFLILLMSNPDQLIMLLILFAKIQLFTFKIMINRMISFFFIRAFSLGRKSLNNFHIVISAHKN